MNQLAKFGNLLKKKRNFMIYSLVAVGIPAAVSFVWILGEGGNLADWLFLIALAFGGAYVSGLLAWRFFRFTSQRSRNGTQISADKN